MRQQLGEQLKCLDVRLESHVALVGELQEFYRRRADVELEYSRGIDKLVKQIVNRHKADKQKYATVAQYTMDRKNGLFWGVHNFATVMGRKALISLTS